MLSFEHVVRLSFEHVVRLSFEHVVRLPFEHVVRDAPGQNVSSTLSCILHYISSVVNQIFMLIKSHSKPFL